LAGELSPTRETASTIAAQRQLRDIDALLRKSGRQMLANELERVKQAERVRGWDTCEQALSGALPFRLPQSPLADDVSGRWRLFETWAEANGVRSLPSKPSTIAAFILDQNKAGMDVTNLLAILDAVEQAHDSIGLSNPVRCALPRRALEQIIKAEPPRSWPKEAKAEFSLLPPDIREIVAKREMERDTALRRAQNQIAEERKALAAGADNKTDSNIEKKETNK
jgi:hypothetical protein